MGDDLLLCLLTLFLKVPYYIFTAPFFTSFSCSTMQKVCTKAQCSGNQLCVMSQRVLMPH